MNSNQEIIQTSQIVENELPFSKFEHILNQTKDTAKNIYCKTGLNVKIIENTASQINQYSEKRLTQLAQSLDRQVNTYLTKYKSLRKSLKEQQQSLIQDKLLKPLIHSAEVLPDKILTHLEEQVQNLQQHFDKDSHVESWEQSKKLKTLERSQNLVNSVNILTKYVLSRCSNELLEFSAIKLISDYLQIANVPQKYLEAKIFFSIANDLVAEQLQQRITAPLQLKYSESVQILKSSQERIILQWSAFNFGQLRETVYQLLSSKYEVLAAGFVSFRQNTLTLEFPQQFYNQYKEQIIEASQALYTQVKAKTDKYQQTALDLYSNVLQMYQQKRQNKLCQLQPVQEQQTIKKDE